MKAADLMTTNVVTIADDATAQDAAVLMLRQSHQRASRSRPLRQACRYRQRRRFDAAVELGTERERSWWLEL
jgi:CBS domain-containing protein